MSIALVWFRQDLRLADNPALTAACDEHAVVIPLYINETTATPPVGGAQRWWLHYSLQQLQQQLAKHHSALLLEQGDPRDQLLAACQRWAVDAVYWNRCYEPAAVERDQVIQQQLLHQGIEVHSFKANLLLEPTEVHTKTGGYFKVFTPFWRHCRQQLQETAPLPIPTIRSHPYQSQVELTDWHLLPTQPNWAALFSDVWQPGEKAALQALQLFIEHHLIDYAHHRDYPGKNSTSHLAAHLHFGEISPRQVWYAVQQALALDSQLIKGTDCYLTEIGWREFCYHLLTHFPQLPTQNFRAVFNQFRWLDDQTALQCWQRGQTGYPIVDAGMRELWQTGSMHNRVRMITASFLTKHLLLDWRLGAAWFWDTLLDADLANNSANWQWVAGSGADAAPYFRIFNPVLQGEKFDPTGAYVRHWVPELNRLPAAWIHQPWETPPLLLRELGIQLGAHYPRPIIEHRRARERALANYQAIKASSGLEGV